MADIEQELLIAASPAQLFTAVTTPAGLDSWWTLSSDGKPVAESEYTLGFGPGYDWRARVQDVELDHVFELLITEADDDWRGTQVRFEITASDDRCRLRFRHLGWNEASRHYRVSCHCWALYLRLLRRYLEFAEIVPYDQRERV